MSLRQSASISDAKMSANRANARHSTGPRSEAGKHRSRLNALEDGRWASGLAWSDESLRALGEDPDEFRQLRLGLLMSDGPSDDPLWELQLEDLARLYWRRRRLERAWEALLRARQGQSGEEDGLSASATDEEARQLQQLDSVDRALDRKTRLVLRMREADERRERRLLHVSRRDRDPILDCAGPLEEVMRRARDNFGLLDPDDMSEMTPETRAMNDEIDRLTEKNRKILELVEAIENDLKNAERSQKVNEKKGSRIQESGFREGQALVGSPRAEAKNSGMEQGASDSGQ